jgi:hypothetical protein
MRLEALRLWRLIGWDVQWSRMRRGQAGCRTGADAVASRCSRAIAMMKQAWEALREATRADVLAWVALPHSQRCAGRSRNRDAHV